MDPAVTLTRFRQGTGLSPSAAAKRAGRNPGLWHRWEHGQRRPTATSLWQALGAIAKGTQRDGEQQPVFVAAHRIVSDHLLTDELDRVVVFLAPDDAIRAAQRIEYYEVGTAQVIPCWQSWVLEVLSESWPEEARLLDRATVFRDGASEHSVEALVDRSMLAVAQRLVPHVEAIAAQTASTN